ncbi:MAG: TonB-dependent receptor [Bacteroidetes bacterium]|nr:TonB-dependent receptor [Bacteroidota bacterium]
MRKTIKYFLFFLLIIPFGGFAQDVIVKGTIIDNISKEALIGVNILSDSSTSSISDLNGNYEIKTTAGTHTLTFSYVGFKEISKSVTANENDTIRLDISLEEELTNVLGDELVITGSMFPKKASEEVISIEVVKPKQILNTNATKIDEVLRRVSGLNVADGQANIRGGSGWAYGVGSRVGFVLDGQTILSPDRGDIKWALLPIETVGQIEVLKGASSVLYGSSAMNGTINLRTEVPTKTPKTRFTSFLSFYGPPKRREAKWWDIPQPSTGFTFMRSHKVSNNFEYTVGGAAYIQNQQYEDGLEYLARVTYRTRWTSKKNERLSWGLAGSFSYNQETEFFYWKNNKEGSYIPSANNVFTNIRLTFDPYVTMYDKKNNKHEILTRTYFNRPSFDTKTILENIDYRFTKQYAAKDFTLIAGANNQFLWINVPDFSGTPNKVANLFAAYMQLDKKYKNLTLSGGVRIETFTYQGKSGVTGTDFKNSSGKRKFYLPGQWRAGLNYQVTSKASIRFNIGQAYRFPSFAERFVDLTLGSSNVVFPKVRYEYSPLGDTVYVFNYDSTVVRNTLAILPNDDLQPEYGWTSEIGYQQKLFSKGKKYSGLIDIAFFWQQYKNMVDFNVNLSDTTYYALIKLKAENITDARIAGLDISLKHAITYKKHSFNIMTGYTYTLPIMLDKYLGYGLDRVGPYLGAFFRHMFTPITGDTASYVLKYRNRHLLTLDFEYTYDNKLTIGVDARYYSNQENFDKLFLAIPGAGIDEYYNNKPKNGDFIVNARMFYTYKNRHTFGFIVKNLTNREYWLRVGKLEPPINFTMQYRLEF